MKQTFTANVVSVTESQPKAVAFAEMPDDPKVLRTLLLMKDDGLEGPESIYLEFNDQGNACTGSSIETVELGSDRLRIVLRNKAGLRAGKVDELSEHILSELEIHFDPEKAGVVRNGLEALLIRVIPIRRMF